MSKGNIKIMNKAQEVSDEEIREMMNFTDLIEKQKAAAAQQAKRSKTIKAASITAGAVILLLSTYLFWPTKTFDSRTSENKSEQLKVENSKTESDIPAAEKNTTKESLHIEKENTPSPQQKEKSAEKKVTSEEQPKPDSEAVEADNTSPVLYMEAEPINGFPHLYEYFNRELSYPKAALKDSIQGIETVSFIINKQGKAESVRIVNSLGAAFDEEALRVIGAMPAWKPAMINSKPIASKISLPLTFNFHTSKQK